MMTPEKEQRLAAEMRLIARQYCDGAFNKIEYRRRRQDILLQCVDQDLSSIPEEPVEPQDKAPVARKAPPTAVNWLPYMMVGVTVVVLGVMGFLLTSMM